MTELSFKSLTLGSAGQDTRDRVFIRDLAIFAHHGVFEAERALGQFFHIDMECVLNQNGPWLNDNPDDVVRYDHICDVVHSVVTGPAVNLLETLAEMLAAKLFEQFDKIAAVRITIRKPHAAIPHKIDTVGVEIVRHRPVANS